MGGFPTFKLDEGIKQQIQRCDASGAAVASLDKMFGSVRGSPTYQIDKGIKFFNVRGVRSSSCLS
jgi:hypothetical protein